MFDDKIAFAVIAAARANAIEPAALLAIVEVETGGKTFEIDGRTPALLYERHIAWREARKVSNKMLAAFRRAGLAIPHWSRSTQYRDERTSSQRLQLIRSARAIDTEVANCSASWGLGQMMGFLAPDLGFDTATDMVASMTGSVPAQIECMVRYLKRHDLIKSLNAHDWRRVARIYNGSGYAQNRYDVRLRDAYTRWNRKLPQLGTIETPRPRPPEQKLARDEVKDIQERLRKLGYHEVGNPDGMWGSRTTAAISAFQTHEGLTVTGHYDERTKAALAAATLPRPISDERSRTTVKDLRDSGSKTVSHADSLSKLATIKKTVGGAILAAGGADQAGILEKTNNALDKVDQARSTWERIGDLFHSAFDNPMVMFLGLFILAAGIAAAVYAERLRQNRLADHQSGVHAGPGGAA